MYPFGVNKSVKCCSKGFEIHCLILYYINPLRHDDAYKRHWTGSPLVQAVICCLFGAKHLPELTITYCQMNSTNKFQWIFNELENKRIRGQMFKSFICHTVILFRDQWVNIVWAQFIYIKFVHGFANIDFNRHCKHITYIYWWRHDMETHYALLALLEGNPQLTGRFPSQRNQ